MEFLGDLLGGLLSFGANAATGGLFGAVARFVTEGVKLVRERSDREFELKMRRLDWEIAKEGGEQKIRQIDRQGEWDLEGKKLDAMIEALRGQSMPSGVPWVDAWNKAMRPGLTSYFAALYALQKFVTAGIAIAGGAGVGSALMLLWTPADTQAFFGILSFWFIGRDFQPRPAGK